MFSEDIKAVDTVLGEYAHFKNIIVKFDYDYNELIKYLNTYNYSPDWPVENDMIILHGKLYSFGDLYEQVLRYFNSLKDRVEKVEVVLPTISKFYERDRRKFTNLYLEMKDKLKEVENRIKTELTPEYEKYVAKRKPTKKRKRVNRKFDIPKDLCNEFANSTNISLVIKDKSCYFINTKTNEFLCNHQHLNTKKTLMWMLKLYDSKTDANTFCYLCS